ncbi:hypothetical protein Lalb_Chr18g0051831 [Lupinus albus]|uniref:Uncharacterized protein n=1 Tax=Lupinus albus TaxID=3870 RepID=A0A6A4NQ26_LUPAL|nr:hypothetical protein Lalb_Chr18g0051831 [Lupinus albus]
MSFFVQQWGLVGISPLLSIYSCAFHLNLMFQLYKLFHVDENVYNQTILCPCSGLGVLVFLFLSLLCPYLPWNSFKKDESRRNVKIFCLESP